MDSYDPRTQSYRVDPELSGPAKYPGWVRLLLWVVLIFGLGGAFWWAVASALF